MLHPRAPVNTGRAVLGKHSLAAQGPRALNHVVKRKGWYLITSINLGGISSLESGPPVRGKMKSDVCRKYYTRLPQGKIFISLPESSLYFSYLSGTGASELKSIIWKWELPCCEKNFQITIKMEWKEWSIGWRAVNGCSCVECQVDTHTHTHRHRHTQHTHTHTHTHTQPLMQIQPYSLNILAFVYIESSLIILVGLFKNPQFKKK